MFKLNQKQFLIKTPSIYDLRANIPPEKRLQTLKLITSYNPKTIVKAGTSDTNPYKEHFDVILANRREQLQKYQDSILWSPRYTPTYIQIPKKMIELKKKGYKLPELEARGYLDGWVFFLQIKEEKDLDETDWTFKQIENFQNNHNFQQNNAPQEKQKNQRQQQYHDKMQNKFNEIAQQRQVSGLQ